MPTTMILRFRDLVAETIAEHRALIEKYDFAWWGWWNKPDERIARHTFASFKEAIKRDGNLEIYLVDSGKQVLYKAKLTDIKVSETEEPVPCPKVRRTPGYYSSRNYKAWFRLTQIEEISQDEVRRFSYDEVLEFLDDPYSTRFQDKRISSIQEMLNRRHRTIYFIKPYDSNSHSDYLIELVPSIGVGSFIAHQQGQRVELVPAIHVGDFVPTPLFREANYVLHLSDLHFSHSKHGFPVTADRAHQPLVTLLEADLEKLGKGKPPAAVIISGDLTWLGGCEEFDLASDFIKKLQSITGLEPQHFVVVPGNHDIQWVEQTNDTYDPKKELTDPHADEAEKHYREFYKEVLGFAPNEFLSMGRRYILGNYVAIDIVGLNSCRLEQKHFAGFGYVGLNQLNSAAERMGWEKGEHPVRHRLLVLHHHLAAAVSEEEIGTYDQRYSLTLDAGQITYRALELGVDLVAHGHMHQPFAASISRLAKHSSFPHRRSLAVHCAGSAGVKREYLGGIGKNSYSVFEFTEVLVTIKVRSFSETVRRFEEDWECCFRKNAYGGLEPFEPQDEVSKKS